MIFAPETVTPIICGRVDVACACRVTGAHDNSDENSMDSAATRARARAARRGVRRAAGMAGRLGTAIKGRLLKRSVSRGWSTRGRPWPAKPCIPQTDDLSCFVGVMTRHIHGLRHAATLLAG